MHLDLRRKRYETSGPAQIASRIQDEQVAGAINMVRHLHRETTAPAYLLQKIGQQNRMVRDLSLIHI